MASDHAQKRCPERHRRSPFGALRPRTHRRELAPVFAWRKKSDATVAIAPPVDAIRVDAPAVKPQRCVWRLISAGEGSQQTETFESQAPMHSLQDQKKSVRSERRDLEEKVRRSRSEGLAPRVRANAAEPATSGAPARGPARMVYRRRPLHATCTAKEDRSLLTAARRRATFEPSRRRLPTRSDENLTCAWPVGLVNVPQQRRRVEPRRARRRVGLSKKGRFLAASQRCARRTAGAQKFRTGA